MHIYLKRFCTKISLIPSTAFKNRKQGSKNIFTQAFSKNKIYVQTKTAVKGFLQTIEFSIVFLL